MRRLSLIMIALAFLVLPGAAPAAAKEQKPVRLRLLQALQEQKISISAKSSAASYHQKGIQLSIENKTAENILLEVDPAMIFAPEEAQYQNLVIEGFELLAVNAGKTRSIDMQSYCGESSDRAPLTGLVYHFQKQGDSIMIKTLQFIHNNKVSSDMAQQAIWVLTDKHSLSDVYDYQDAPLSRRLTEFMGKLLGLEAPQYFTLKELSTMQGAPVLNKKTLKLIANLKWSLAQPEPLSLSIYNDKGEKVASYFDHKDFRKGQYDLNASFETVDYPEGTYTIKLYSDKEVLKQMIIELR